MNKIRL